MRKAMKNMKTTEKIEVMENIKTMNQTEIGIQQVENENSDLILLCGELDEYLNQAIGGESKREKYKKFNHLDTMDYVVVIYDRKIPAGCGALRKYSEKEIEVKRVFVRSEYRGRHMGDLILKNLISKAKSMGFHRMLLETGEFLQASVHLYSKYGFEKIENYGAYRDMKESLCMALELIEVKKEAETMINIRKATGVDIESLMSSRIETVKVMNHLPEDTVFDEEFMDKTRAYFQSSYQTTVLAMDREEVIGCATICYINIIPTPAHPTGKRAHIMNVHVREPYRRQRIAFQMINMLLTEAKQRGVTEISLDATESGRPLYEKCGFVENQEGMIWNIKNN